MSFFQQLKEGVSKVVEAIELNDSQMKARAEVSILRRSIFEGFKSGNRSATLNERLSEAEALSPKGPINKARAIFTKVNRLRQGLADTMKML